jgi:hypothetical protein
VDPHDADVIVCRPPSADHTQQPRKRTPGGPSMLPFSHLLQCCNLVKAVESLCCVEQQQLAKCAV